jgi:hypothetical protein
MSSNVRSGEPQKTGLSKLQRYVFDVIELRRAIDLNRQDSEFADRGGRIVYFVDADVAYLFIDPANNTSQVEVFHGRAETKPRSARARSALIERYEGVPELSAAVCAEYIFGGQLPGQKGEPIRICFHHSIELENLVEREVSLRDGEWEAVEADLKRHGNEIRSALGKALANSKGDTDSPEKLAVELSQKLPPAVAEWIVQKGVAFNQDRRLNGKLLAPAAGLKEFTEDVIKPRSECIDQWINRLISSRLGTGKPTASSGLLGNIVRDATVLAQIEHLNKHADHQEVHFVLISATRGVHAAVAKWNDDETGDHVRNFVRHPRQFIALLNFDSMQSNTAAQPSGTASAPSLIPELEAATDTLLRYFVPSEKRKKLKSGYDLEAIEAELEKNLNGVSSATIDEQLTRVQGKWFELAKNASTLKRYMLSDMCSVIVSLVEDVVRRADSDPDTALIEGCKTHVESISRENALAVALDVAPKLVAKESPRSPAHFHHLLELEDELDMELNSIIASFREDRVAAAESFRKWLKAQQAGPGQAHFVAGALMLQLDDWSGALFYLDQAQKDIERYLKVGLQGVGSASGTTLLSSAEIQRLPYLDAAQIPTCDLLHEVLYAKVVVLRFLLLKDDRLGGVNLAERCVEYHLKRIELVHDSNYFRAARGLSELAATRLAVCSNLFFVSNGGSLNKLEDQAFVRQEMERAAGAIARAQNLCSARYAMKSEEQMHIRFQAVDLQLLTNHAGLIILQDLWVKDQSLARFEADASPLFAKLEAKSRVVGEPMHFAPDVNYKLLEWIVYRQGDRSRALSALREAQTTVNKTLADKRAKMTAYDKAELVKLGEMLRSEVDRIQ